MINKFAVYNVLFAAALAASGCAAAQTPVDVSVSVDPRSIVLPIPQDFQGLSMGINYAPKNSSGGYYFNVNNQSLINLFGTMGVRILRMGPSGPALTTDENDSLLNFAKAANVKIIYGLNIPAHSDSPASWASITASDAATINYIGQRYASNVYSYCFGNEPNTAYGEPTGGSVIVGTHTDSIYLQYQTDWLQTFNTVLGGVTLSTPPMFYGPSTTPAAENWAINFSDYMVATPNIGSHINLISQHEYPFGGGQPSSLLSAAIAYGPYGSNPTAAQALSFARVRMVRNNDSKYAGLWDNTALPAGDPGAYSGTYFIPYMIKDGIPFRMEETNSYSNHGAEGASDAYAAALWGLDYEYWLVAHNAAGVNFMTGFNNQNDLSPLSYSAFQSTYVSDAKSTTTQVAYGLAYGMVAFKLASQGKLVQTTSAIANVSPTFNLSCYSVAGDDGAIYVTVINKDNLDNTSTVRSANVTVSLPSTYTINSVQSCVLLGTGNSVVPGDISNKNGITIGGKVINSDGTWTGGFSNGALNLVQSKPNVIGLSVPPASATVLKLSASVVPDAPTGPGVTPLSDSQLGLDWSESTGDVTSYQIQISSDGKSWTNLTSLLATSQPTMINTNSYRYIASNLNPSTTYFFQVSCTGVGGTSVYSASTSNTTGASISDGIPGWWRLQYFGNGLSIIAGVSGPQDDPGSSGIPNLLAYATGISPTAANPNFGHDLGCFDR